MLRPLIGFLNTYSTNQITKQNQLPPDHPSSPAWFKYIRVLIGSLRRLRHLQLLWFG